MPHSAPLTDAERSALVLDNQGLVYHIAKRYSWPGAWSSDGDYQDLVGVGIEALVKAARAFDPSKGTFSGYAGRAIENAMTSVIRRNRNDWTMLQRLFSGYVDEGGHRWDGDGRHDGLRETASQVGDDDPSLTSTQRLLTLYHVFDGHLNDAMTAYARQSWGWLARIVALPPPENDQIKAWAGPSLSKALNRDIEAACLKLGCPREYLNIEMYDACRELHRRTRLIGRQGD